jgi:hypothetical protein
MNGELAAVEWDREFDGMDVDGMWGRFMDYISGSLERHVPAKIITKGLVKLNPF